VTARLGVVGGERVVGLERRKRRKKWRRWDKGMGKGRQG